VRTYKLSDFDFTLPEELIAQSPPAERRASRLLVVKPDAAPTRGLTDCRFDGLPELLNAGDLVIFNDTRVIRARLHGRKATGGKIEVMVDRLLGAHAALAQIRASHAPQVGSALLIGGSRVTVTAREGRLFHLHLEGASRFDALLEQHGEIPLPPYIARPATDDDAARYQTVYAKEPGAVAAPTAGLHFDPQMLEALAARGIAIAFVTLHVGAGTFLPVQSENLAGHQMHSEWFDVPRATVDAIEATRKRSGQIVAVGTTTLRALESAAANVDLAENAHAEIRHGAQETALFITPGYRFRVVDRLLTNFHLPKSTLLMLVSAFAGYDTIRDAYAHAIALRYRFFSYGDAMLLTRAR